MKINTKDIINDKNLLIRKKSENVQLPISDENREILLAMLEYVRNSTDVDLVIKDNLKPAVGMAAIQIGVPKKMLTVVVDMYDKDDKVVRYEYALVNPRIISHSVSKAYLENGEGCLSVDLKHEGYVYRHRKITVKGYDILQEKEIEIKAKDYLAIVLQHELDHLDGVLYYDHIDQANPFKVIKDAYMV